VKLTWQHVAVIGLVVTGVIVLAALGRDTTAFIGLAIAILLGVGLVQQGEIKNATNGNTSRLVSLMETMANHLAKAAPPSEPPPPPAGDS
jgi:hypothetical protein